MSENRPSIHKTKNKLIACFKFGDGEIRTHGGIAPTQPFQDCTLNRSDTSPHVLSLFIYYHEHKIYDNIFL